ncbi:MAG: transposase, partial [Verrucomicrobiota bacterium]
MPPATELYAQNLALKAEVEELRSQVAWFRRQLFGSNKTERWVETPTQTQLGLPETPRAEVPRQTVTYQRRTPAPEKRPVPAEVFAHLPVQEKV